MEDALTMRCCTNPECEQPLKPSTLEYFGADLQRKANGGFNYRCLDCLRKLNETYRRQAGIKLRHLLLTEEEKVKSRRASRVREKAAREARGFVPPPATKICNGPLCNGMEKPAEEFGPRMSADGLYSVCRVCHSHRETLRKAELRVTDWSAYLLDAVNTRLGFRSKGKRREERLELTIDREWILIQFARQGGACYWTGIPLEVARGEILRFPSLDRLDNSQGYTPDNVVIACWTINMGRRHTPAEEFAAFCNQFLCPHGLEEVSRNT